MLVWRVEMDGGDQDQGLRLIRCVGRFNLVWRVEYVEDLVWWVEMDGGDQDQGLILKDEKKN